MIKSHLLEIYSREKWWGDHTFHIQDFLGHDIHHGRENVAVKHIRFRLGKLKRIGNFFKLKKCNEFQFEVR